MKTSILQSSNSVDFPSLFKETCDSIVSISKRQGRRIVGYRSPKLEHFTKIGFESQKEVLEYLSLYHRALEQVQDSEEGFVDERKALWYVIRSFGLRPPSNLFEVVEESDVVEIYSPQGIQLWRNFNFMDICSYSLEEMYCFEWWERYYRYEQDNERCLKAMGGMLSPESPELVKHDIDIPYMEEIFSENRFVLKARHKWFAKLSDSQKNVAGVLATSSVNILGTTRELGSKFQEATPATPYTGPELVR